MKTTLNLNTKNYKRTLTLISVVGLTLTLLGLVLLNSTIAVIAFVFEIIGIVLSIPCIAEEEYTTIGILIAAHVMSIIELIILITVLTW